ncbi:DUF3370 domain-containing protein [Leptolyngbya sp. AN02str]|uniref:DUF3370 domain-containing protein n=1 Tax=Leptolyngbya sp. AN02str TaxID=3423363 RepID=UPI003D3219CE
MLKLLPLIPLAQVLIQPAPVLPPPVVQPILQPQEVRALPGELDEVPVFNSNSPEVVQQAGILLSTFPKDGRRSPSAHLEHTFEGRFDIFAHHIARGLTPNDVRTLFIGILLHNPSDRPVTVDVLQAVTYLSQEAPFHNLPSYVLNSNGSVFAGPGSRTTTDMLRGVRQGIIPERIVLAPGSTQLLANLPIPLRSLELFRNGAPLPQDVGLDAAEALNPFPGEPQPGAAAVPPRRELPINGRTAQMYLSSDGPVHIASLGMHAKVTSTGVERAPSLAEWMELLDQGNLAGPRDIAPSPPNARRQGRFFYGRVAGVSQGSRWEALLTDSERDSHLTIPEPGEAISFAISTVDNNTLGTGQIQSAPMLQRYSDTAYRSHGNYGVHYNLRLPLRNDSDRPRQVAILFQTPIKDEQLRGQGLRFLNPPQDRIFYRGTIRLRYRNDWGVLQTRYVHVVQRRGQQGEPLITLQLRQGDRREVEVDFFYPPDATPPQVLTVQTLDGDTIPNPDSDGAPVLSSQPTSLQPALPEAIDTLVPND